MGGRGGAKRTGSGHCAKNKGAAGFEGCGDRARPLADGEDVNPHAPVRVGLVRERRPQVASRQWLPKESASPTHPFARTSGRSTKRQRLAKGGAERAESVIERITVRAAETRGTAACTDGRA